MMDMMRSFPSSSRTRPRLDESSPSPLRWSELPDDLLESIASSLDSILDYIRLRAVSKSWRSSLPSSPRHQHHDHPWLMIPSNGRLNYNPRYLRFYNPHDGKTHALYRPELYNMRCVGASHGWLAMEEGTPAPSPISKRKRKRKRKGKGKEEEEEKGIPCKVSLINPITRRQIQLPPLSSLVPNYDDIVDIRTSGRVILSSDPATNPNTTMVATIMHYVRKSDGRSGRAPAWCIVGEQSWRRLSIPTPPFCFGLMASFYDGGKLCVLYDKQDGQLSDGSILDSKGGEEVRWRYIAPIIGWEPERLLQASSATGSPMMLIARSHYHEGLGLFQLELGDGKQQQLEWKIVLRLDPHPDFMYKKVWEAVSEAFGCRLYGNCIYVYRYMLTTERGQCIFRICLDDRSVTLLPMPLPLEKLGKRLGEHPMWLQPNLC